MAMPNFIRPFPAKNITDDFDDHVKRGSANPGTDYAAAKGANVNAVADGVIELVRRTPTGSGGRIVIIAHSGGWHTEYLHLSTIRVKPGQKVKQGQCIGEVGGSGHGKENYYGYHLHLTLSSGKTALTKKGNVDFEKALKAQQASTAK